MSEIYRVGQTVELNDGRQAVVRYIGEPTFAQGQWVGVEFADAVGKNDGAVRGERYFDCAPGHGMFLKPTGISRILEQPKTTPRANGRPVSQPPKGRPSSFTMDQSSKTRSASRPSSMALDPKGALSQTGSTSPIKRPLSTVVSRSRPSMAPLTNKRMSIAPTPPSSAQPRSTARLSIGGTQLGSTRVGGSISTGKAPVSRPSLAPTKKSSPPSTVKKAPTPSVSSTSTTTRGTITHDKQVEELEAKLRIMEKKRIEDREKLKALERLQQERDKFESIIQKLQAKYQPQQQENVDLKKQLKEAESRLEQIEAIQEEHDTLLEMATLDREMAEEKADAFRSENADLKQTLEELKLENEILKDENQELGQDMSPEERTSAGWLQMERENERLREALLRLRDISQEQEAELKNQIKSLEEDVQDLAEVKQQYDDTKARLLECEADIEDLRQQLDAALGAEEMIEELSEQNMSLKEQIDELKITIDDLQSLKELNDELEVNHVENEKQLQEVIDFKDSLISEQTRRATQQEETLTDQEYTISRFRELVTNLQSDLEDLRSTKEISEAEAQELSNRSKQMMDLNRQLQASASNTKIKTIDMELRKLEAQEAAEHLAIVQLFLPEAFHSERDSVLALLRFKRIGFKAHLLHGFVKDRVSGTDRHIHDDDVFDACDVLDKLTWIAAMCERFVNSISGCSLEQFARFEGALYELEPVERALNGYIDGLKRDELREKQVASELHRSVALMSHLAEIHLSTTLDAYADDVLMRTLLMQSYLETTAAALSLIKSGVQSHIPIIPDDENDDIARFTQKVDSMITQSRSAKVVVSKTIRALQELKSRSLSLTTDTLDAFEECERGTEQLALYTRQLGEKVYSVLMEEGRTEPITFSEIRSTLFHTTVNSFPDTTNESDLFFAMGAKCRTLTDALANLNALSLSLSSTAEFERAPAPWVLRAKELAASKIMSVDAEEEIRRLKDEVHARATALKLRDQEIEEKGVKIELLEARTRDASKKAIRIKELESRIEELRGRERALVEESEGRSKEIRALEEERERWATQAAIQAKIGQNCGGGVGKRDVGADKVATKRELEILGEEVRILESANRFLRRSNRKDLIKTTLAADSWLYVPVKPSSNPQTSRAQAMVTTGRKALEELVNLPAKTQHIDLTPHPPKERLKWRPLAHTPRYQLKEQEVRRAQVPTWDMKLFSGGLNDFHILKGESWNSWDEKEIGLVS
ncbi:hypothetical protein AOQ84DRAFT_436916 [Glonium stellatum]|uniref:CAP-Gly domain-containing protein n=1 Tax=Glonium stellatum TaxID=574774 RepID=A0A8E2F9J8_9PEZI|nr:hypothetical protein AOQ84DRAFT_436916 [Glonium stellatum]